MQSLFATRFVFFILIAFSCKTTSPPVYRRNTAQPEASPSPSTSSGTSESTTAGEILQSVTRVEIQSAPPLTPAKTETTSPVPEQKIMVPEVGSECKFPVTANCLKIPYPEMEVQVLNLSPVILKKYSRPITPAEHKCLYFDRQLPPWGNISYFPDAVVYWSDRDASSVIFNALPVNFIFSAGCEIGADIPNPYTAELKATSSWDGQSTLKSLGYKIGIGQPVPASFTTDKLKAEKVTQASQACSFAIRPMIYVFPDGVIYQFVGSGFLNIYPMTQVQGVPCSTPPGMLEAIKVALPKCNVNTLNPDPKLRKTLQDLGIMPKVLTVLSARNYLNQDLIDAIEINGKPIAKELLNCTFASRTKIHQFTDGIAFVNPGCTEMNVYSNEYLKTRTCTIPPYP